MPQPGCHRARVHQASAHAAVGPLSPPGRVAAGRRRGSCGGDFVRLLAPLTATAGGDAYLTRFKGSSREHTESDLRCSLTWCADHDLDPLAVQRFHLELYIPRAALKGAVTSASPASPWARSNTAEPPTSVAFSAGTECHPDRHPALLEQVVAETRAFDSIAASTGHGPFVVAIDLPTGSTANGKPVMAQSDLGDQRAPDLAVLRAAALAG
jgi:hypothetical protein